MTPTQQVLQKIEELGDEAASWFGVSKATISTWKKGNPPLRAYEMLLEPEEVAPEPSIPLVAAQAMSPPPEVQTDPVRVRASDVLEMIQEIRLRLDNLERNRTVPAVATQHVPGPVAVPIANGQAVKQPKQPARAPTGFKNWAAPIKRKA